MTSFRTTEHQIPAQHIREYPNATANSQEEVLFLCVKQYIPLNNQDPRPGDVTILAAHANGFPKELYEPLWDHLLQQSARDGWRIRSIWIADSVQSGQSSILNEPSLGNDPCWNDHARDLLHLVNTKRDEMPRPIVGIGHSIGGFHLAQLALMHPRLLTSLILLDPAIIRRFPGDPRRWPSFQVANFSSNRRTLWPSREAAATAFGKAEWYQAWDPRVRQKWIEFALRDAPTVLYPDAKKPQVTLTTTNAQEAFIFIRPNRELDYTSAATRELSSLGGSHDPYFRLEMREFYPRLAHLLPPLLYVFGEKSYMRGKDTDKDMVGITGSGVGGSGGQANGMVKSVMLEGAGHLLPMEVPQRTAEAVAEWLVEPLARFQREEKEWREKWVGKSLKEKQEIDDRWKKTIADLSKKAKL